MVFLWKKQQDVQLMLERYFEQCDECFNLLDEAFSTYEKKGLGPEFDETVSRTHTAESAADDLRREIELTLYGKALLPESRGDLLGLLEAFDGLPNKAETVLFAVKTQRLALPEWLTKDLRRLLDVNLQAYFLVRKAVNDLFHNPRTTLHSTKAVDEKESESDRLERDIITRIFEREGDAGTKLLQKEIVLLIGSLSDRAETTADRISIVAIKRQI